MREKQAVSAGKTLQTVRWRAWGNTQIKSARQVHGKNCGEGRGKLEARNGNVVGRKWKNLLFKEQDNGRCLGKKI